jgi:hypothetical protein
LGILWGDVSVIDSRLSCTDPNPSSTEPRPQPISRGLGIEPDKGSDSEGRNLALRDESIQGFGGDGRYLRQVLHRQRPSPILYCT